MMVVLRTLLIWSLSVLWVADCAAQQLTPRAYWPAPKGTKVLVIGYSRTVGDLVLDQSLPVSGADSKIGLGLLAYVQTLDLWGRSSNLVVDIPYANGTTKGLVNQEAQRRNFSGFGDLGCTLTVNLLGAPSMNLEEFQALRANPRPILGASLKVVAPTGSYDSDKLVNISENRWAARVQIGSIIPIKPKLLLELMAGTWFFGDDDDYLTGKREQEPIYSLEADLIKRFRPGFWASLNFTYFRGGRQTIGGEQLDDEQSNLKVGGTVVVPFRGRHAIKLGYANGAKTKYGTNFDQVLLSYQVLLN